MWYGAKPRQRYQARRQNTFDGSYLERGMGGRKAIAGGELCVSSIKGRGTEAINGTPYFKVLNN